MDNITYLVGAGASANCLPVVEQIPARISETISVLRQNQYQLSGSFPDVQEKSKLDLQTMMVKDFEWLLEKSIKHSSIDTFAKKLYLKDSKEELRKLKFLVSVFFVVEQIVKQPDIRYDTFFASILNENIRKFPSNVKIVSWNYDYQFEISYSEFSDEFSLGTIQSALNVHSKFQDKFVDPSGFSIYKLNGSIGYQIHANNAFHYFVQNHQFQLTSDDLSQIVYLYSSGVYPQYFQSKTPIRPTLSFAWEAENASQTSIVNRVVSTIRETTILVIIGYSFPFFNREIDRAIVNSLYKLKKVYFQSLDETDVLTSRFRSVYDRTISNEQMGKVYDLKQFYLPPEL